MAEVTRRDVGLSFLGVGKVIFYGNMSLPGWPMSIERDRMSRFVCVLLDNTGAITSEFLGTNEKLELESLTISARCVLAVD